MSVKQADYRVSFTKHGPFWVWRGWHESDYEWSSPWGRGISLSKQGAIWAARRRMIGRIVEAHRKAGDWFSVDGDELVKLADAAPEPSPNRGGGAAMIFGPCNKYCSFQGMSLKEIGGMPMTGEATGNQLAAIWLGKPVWCVDVALRQETYVRECWINCPFWRPWKKQGLAFALRRTEAVTRLCLFGWTPSLYEIRRTHPAAVKDPSARSGRS